MKNLEEFECEMKKRIEKLKEKGFVKKLSGNSTVRINPKTNLPHSDGERTSACMMRGIALKIPNVTVTCEEKDDNIIFFKISLWGLPGIPMETIENYDDFTYFYSLVAGAEGNKFLAKRMLQKNFTTSGDWSDASGSCPMGDGWCD